MRSKLRQSRRNLDLWSRREYAALDGRLVEAREEKRIIDELVAHLGGKVTAPQRYLIKRAARALVMIGIVERRVIEGGELGDLQARQLVALSNSIRLALTAIGMDRPEQQAPALKSYLGGAKAAA